MNKNDVLEIVAKVATDPFFNEFKVKKTDCSIIRKTPVGFWRVIFPYYNSYDLDRRALAVDIRPEYEIRFNVLHK